MWGIFAHCYQLKSITNTTYYKPGQWFSAEVAQQICNIPNWEITIVGDDIIDQVLGVAGSVLSVAGQAAAAGAGL